MNEATRYGVSNLTAAPSTRVAIVSIFTSEKKNRFVLALAVLKERRDLIQDILDERKENGKILLLRSIPVALASKKNTKWLKEDYNPFRC